MAKRLKWKIGDWVKVTAIAGRFLEDSNDLTDLYIWRPVNIPKEEQKIGQVCGAIIRYDGFYERPCEYSLSGSKVHGKFIGHNANVLIQVRFGMINKPISCFSDHLVGSTVAHDNLPYRYVKACVDDEDRQRQAEYAKHRMRDAKGHFLPGERDADGSLLPLPEVPVPRGLLRPHGFSKLV